MELTNMMRKTLTVDIPSDSTRDLALSEARRSDKSLSEHYILWLRLCLM